jgi:hypothetical protein
LLVQPHSNNTVTVAFESTLLRWALRCENELSSDWCAIRFMQIIVGTLVAGYLGKDVAEPDADSRHSETGQPNGREAIA